MRDDNDQLITTIRVPEYMVPQAFLRAHVREENPNAFLHVAPSSMSIDLGALVDYLVEHLEPCPVRLEYAPKQTTAAVLHLEVWLTGGEAEKYIETHKPGALAELVTTLARRAAKAVESINTMRSLE